MTRRICARARFLPTQLVLPILLVLCTEEKKRKYKLGQREEEKKKRKRDTQSKWRKCPSVFDQLWLAVPSLGDEVVGLSVGGIH